MKFAVNYSRYANLSWRDDAGADGGLDAARANGHKSLADPSHDGVKLALRAIAAYRGPVRQCRRRCIPVSRIWYTSLLVRRGADSSVDGQVLPSALAFLIQSPQLDGGGHRVL